MNPTEFCLSAVVTKKALDHILETAGTTGGGAYKDNHPWYVARELLAEAADAGLALPILLATDDPLEFSHWAFVKDIDVEEFHRGTWETRCEFVGLAPMNPIWVSLDSVALFPSKEQQHREAIEPIHMHRQFLDEHLVRPYAVCETPPFILGGHGDSAQDDA